MKKQTKGRLKFSLKTLLATVTLLAVGLGGWIAYSRYKIEQLTELRQHGVIVIIRDSTPKAFRAVGIKQLHPFYSVPTIELYVAPQGTNAFVGNSAQLLPNADAKKYLIEQATAARNYGAKDIQLGIIDGFDDEWFKFAFENSLSPIGERKQRYTKRLKPTKKLAQI